MSKRNEIWKEIKGFPGYLISNHGRVWSQKTKRERKTHRQHKGYWQVVLSYRNETKTIRLNRLVLFTFMGNAPSPVHQAAHRDGDKDNNSLSNLYWATPEENAADRKRHGTYRSGSDHPMAKLSNADLIFARWLRSIGKSWKEIGEEVGVTADTISRRVRLMNYEV